MGAKNLHPPKHLTYNTLFCLLYLWGCCFSSLPSKTNRRLTDLQSFHLTFPRQQTR